MRVSKDRALRMGAESIPRLLVEFSLPVMTGMVVQAVYNIVNRMFIGNAPEAATLGIAAITIGMPIVLVSMAFGGLIGFGGAAALSIYLGEQNNIKAELTLGNSLSLAILTGLFLTLFGLAFLEPLLVLFGATADVLPYAREYNRMIILGSIPMTLSFVLSNFIRAEGNPNRSMSIMMASAILNVALDALFIAGLHMGVFGAALGTVLSQSFATFLVLHYYLTRRSHVRLRAGSMKLDREIARRALSLGSSAFFLHIGNSFLQFVLNNQVTRYGGDVALAAWGVIHTVGLFFLFPIFGINGGSQPLIGYNYGARMFPRVKSAAKWAIVGASGIALFAFAAIQLAAHQIAGLFSGDDLELLELSAYGLRAVNLLLPAVGFQIVASGYFTSVGKPLKAMFLTLSRQLLFLVPLVLILPRFMGLKGIFFAVPAADVCAVSVTSLFFVSEMRRLRTR